MAVEFKFNEESMLKSIESMQKGLKDKGYDSTSEEGKRSAYASLLAARAIAKAERGKKKSLKVPGKTADWQTLRDTLANSACFQAFVQKQGHETMKKELTTGHGGLCEENFQKFVLEQSVLPTDLPKRWMPKAKDRIEEEQKRLQNLEPGSKEAVTAYAEIFRARRSVKAQRNQLSILEETTIDGTELAKQTDLANNELFQSFVQQNPYGLKSTILKGHGGEAEQMFRDHVLQLDHIPATAPEEYMPSALDRTAALMNKLKNGGTDEQQFNRYAELMATREAVGAVRGKKSSLEKPVPAQALNTAYEKWSKCETFKRFVEDKSEEARQGLTGHGGAVSDAFKEHVKNLDHIPADVPADHMPTAYEHLESLKAKLSEAAYYDSSDERKLNLAAELMASREAVQAVRGKAESLKKPLDAEKLNTAYKRWAECKVFKDFILSQDPRIRNEAHTAAVTGHGGALEDKFREHINGLEKLDGDIPAAYMPRADQRIEALQKKIRENPGLEGERKLTLYAEIMAARSSVNAVRGKGSSLEVTLDPAALTRDRENLLKSDSFKRFINDPAQQAAIREAVNKGHAGALEDKYKEYVKNLDRIDEFVPKQYMPKAEERIDALKAKINAPGFQNAENKNDIYVELMATRQAVNAVRGEKKSLEPVVDAGALKTARESWAQCVSFRQFLQDGDQEEIKTAAAKGHGGALLDKFKEHVAREPQMPEDLPPVAVPTALERIDAIKKELADSYEFLENDEKAQYAAQILAARENVGAQRKKPDTLKVKLDPKTVNEAANKLAGCAAFLDYMTKKPDEFRRLALSGHGGELAEKFREHVKSMDELPEDTPTQYAPTALERIEALQKRVKQEYDGKTLEEKTELLAQIIGARRAIHAVRGEKDSLKYNLDPKTAAQESKKLSDCEAFKQYVREHPNDAKSAARSGHAGELEDKFKEYVLNMDHIPGDVPDEYMPTALERTKVLQKKIDSRDFNSRSAAEQENMLRELMATRAAVNSVRGDKTSLNPTVNAKKLQECRQNLAQCGPLNDLFRDTDMATLKKAANAGHGGQLDDKLRDCVKNQTARNGVIPEKVPKRFKPTPAQMLEKIQADLKQDRTVHGMQYYDIMKQDYMKQIACAMYCKKLQHDAHQNGVGSPELDPEKMNCTVDKLMNSQAFKAMFQQNGSTYRMADCVANQRMSELFTQLSNRNGQLEMEQPQPVLQNQPIVNQNQNQPVVNQNQNQPVVNQNQNQNQPIVNQNQQNQQNQQLNNQLLQNLNQQGLYINQHGQLVNQLGQPVNMQGQPLNQQQANNGQPQANNNGQQLNNNGQPGRQRGGSMHQPAPRQIQI